MSSQLINYVSTVALLNLTHNFSGIQILIQISVKLMIVVFFVHQHVWRLGGANLDFSAGALILLYFSHLIEVLVINIFFVDLLDPVLHDFELLLLD